MKRERGTGKEMKREGDSREMKGEGGRPTEI